MPVKDDATIKLVVLVKPDVRIEDARRIILEKPEGGRRTFANTVAVVYPSPAVDFEVLLGYVARIKAAREIMDALSEYYRDKDIRSLQGRKLKRYIDDNAKLLMSQLLSALTRVAYPRGEDVEEREATPSTSIIAQVEALLKDPRTGEKLRTSISFEDLKEFLKGLLNWDLAEGDRRFEFRDILEVFYTNPAAPFTTREAIEQAILSGVEALDIGVKIGDKLYWKRIGPEGGADRPERIGDTDVILPHRDAAKILRDKLLSESGIRVEPEGARRIWYEVEIADKVIPLEDLVKQEGWESVVKEGLILMKEEFVERGFMLEVKPSFAEVKPGAEVEASISIEPIGGYSEDVAVEANGGTLDAEGGKPPLRIGWRIKPPRDPGKYSFTVKVTGSDGSTKEGGLLITVLSPEVDKEVDRIDLGHVGAKLVAITAENMMAMRLALDITSELGVDAEVDVSANFGRVASFRGGGMDVRVARLFIEKFNDILSSLRELMAETSLAGIVRLREPLILDSTKIAPLLPLAGKARFTLRVKREVSNRT